MRILIHGGGFVNKGAEAMVLTAQRELARRVPRARFLVPASPDAARLVESENCEPVLGHRTTAGKVVCLVAGALTSRRLARVAVESPRDVPSLRHIVRCRADAMVDVSGFAIGDRFPGSARYHLHLMECLNGVRARSVVYLPQAWGPFSNPHVVEPAAQVCRLARAIYARDRQSHAYLQNLPGRPDGKLHLGSDVAFRFQGAASEEGRALLVGVGVSPHAGPVIGIVPNMRVYERTEGKGPANRYVQLLAAVAAFCSGRLGAQLALIPHEIRSGASRDDRYLCSLVQEAAGNGRVFAMTGDYTAAEVKSVIGHVELLISSRYHATIAALSQRIPAVVVGWAHKYDELMRDVGLGEYVLQCKTADQDSLLPLVKQAWQRRRELAEVLESTVPPMEKSADAVFDHTAELLLECRW